MPPPLPRAQTPAPPRLPDPPPDGEPTEEELEEGLDERVLRSLDLSGRRQDRFGLLDCALERCDLSNVHARGGSFVRVACSGGRLTGLSVTEGLLRDVRFRDCRIDLGSFAASKLERVVFQRCQLTALDLRDADLRSVRFEECQLDRAELSGARFQRCELRGCRLDGATGLERLRGVAIEWSDLLALAGGLAAALGIRAVDDDELS